MRTNTASADPVVLAACEPLSHLDLLNVNVFARNAVVGVVEEDVGLLLLVVERVQDGLLRPCPALARLACKPDETEVASESA